MAEQEKLSKGAARRMREAVLVSASVLSLMAGRAWAGEASDPLAAGFANPPNSARPRVWWHWMNGNVTKEGIAKDLAWMSRVGLGGLQNFDAALATPQVVPKRLAYMTPEWKDAFRFAVQSADQLGLEFGIAGSPGWSESGGPWVPPQDAMKKLVWSETIVDGGRAFDGRLRPPPAVTGPYQDIAAGPGIAAMMGGGGEAPRPQAYGDAAVVAFRMSDSSAPLQPHLRARDGSVIDPAMVADPGGAGVTVPLGPGEAPGVILIEYDRPQTVRSASFHLPGGAMMFFGPSVMGALEAQDAAGGWRRIADVEPGAVPTTISFAPVTAQRFRFVIRPVTKRKTDGALGIGLPGVVVSFPGFPAAKSARVSLLQLSPEARVNRFEAKAGFTLVDDYYALDKDAGPDIAGVDPRAVVDLTGRIRPDGGLDWTPPPGRWKVLRLGWSLTGTTNHPATKEATGLEVDEYDAGAVRRYLETYLGMYREVTGPELMGKRGLRAQVNDSTEVGPSNWTPAMLDQFQRLRGYDPRPWLPALTGTVVGSRSQSDAFLYDFRRTLADLVASQHYETVAEVVRDHGMTGYGEALESARVVLGDDMAMRRHADVPMSAMWAYNPSTGVTPVYLTDMKGAASVAHVYGQNLTAAESMTASMAPWAFAPSDLKRYIDLEFASGINRPVIHTSVHQPMDDKVPGLSLMIFGQYFNRHETWAEMARPWVDYMARSSYLLQQGRNVADVAYFYGEEAPLVALYKDGPPKDAPTRYAYDFANADVVLRQLSVDGGELVSPAGARYRALYLGGSSARMTLAVLRRIAALAEAGATIVGPAPESSPALTDDRAAFAALVKRLWGGGSVTPVGRGRVIASREIEAALQSVGLGPDVSFAGAAPDSQILFVHRRLADGDIYYLANRKPRTERVEARFRVTGRAAEIWRADSGASSPAGYRIEGAETAVPLELGPEEAVFVVFRKPASAPSRTVAETAWRPLAEVDGAWDVSFQPDRGAPPSARFDRLRSLTESAEPGIKYFSGTATYRTSFTLPRTARPGRPLMLDLGRVGDIAEVSVNGKPVGYAWKAPYRLDVGKAVRPGRNQLEVKVADLWVNRLIGDAQPGAKKITFTTLPTYKPDAPLRPSGLIGPVTLLGSDAR